MAKQRHFIREWRKHRGLNQEDLAAQIGITREYVSFVENGKRRYDQNFLESAAVALNCTPADLIMRDPSQPDPIWPMWNKIPAAQRDQALRVLQTFTATDAEKK